MQAILEKDRRIWFSMWFLSAVATFGLAFFPMFYRFIESRNRHFRREHALEEQIAEHLRRQGKGAPTLPESAVERSAKAWAASIILVVPAFVITYLLSKDLIRHEKQQDAFLAKAFPERIFMPQTVPIKKYALITIITLGVGIVYWLYKIINMYNAHFKAHRELEKEIIRLMEEKRAEKPV
ncbi:MAG: hypothetical protein QW674_03705 [Candidatus Bathyarchaeia archaeon]